MTKIKIVIDGDEHIYSSTEPIAIANKIRNVVPNSTQTGLTKRIIDWSWEQLCNKTIGKTFYENGVYMESLDDALVH